MTRVTTEIANMPSVWIEVNRKQLLENLKTCQSFLSDKTGTMAIIKSNAYGHGLIECAEVLESSVQYFGVSDVGEALMLRDHGFQIPILIFGFCSLDDIPTLLKYDLSVSLSDSEFAKSVHERILQLGWDQKLKVHIKVDTGMSRLGFPYHKTVSEIEKLSEYSSLELEGIFTHLAASDKQENDFTGEQLELFEKVLLDLKQKNFHFKWRHSANSGGLLQHSNSHFNLVRPGIALYGLFQEESQATCLKPILSWKTRVVLTKDLNPGDTVSYGRKFQTAKSTRIAVLPVGYSHGYPLGLSSKGSVLIGGRRYPIAGQVCMDHTVIELGLESPVSTGDEVVLIGRSGDEVITATELAKLAGTICYDIVTRLHPSVHRIYLG